MNHPYVSLPAKAFWRTGVAEPGPYGVRALWSPKYEIAPTDRVITAGSCFAQHIGRALASRGYQWLDAEPAPVSLPDPAKYNYGIFSFRTANIYTTALLRQWLTWAVEGEPPCIEAWEADGRWYDPLRPTIEPGGFDSRDEMEASRRSTLRAIRNALSANVFVFTLGLTEGWVNSDTGLVYAACPGTMAGEFDPAQHAFVNYEYEEIARDLKAAIAIARSANPNLRFLLTVSPVPLTATATPDAHVLAATTYSKSVLRAVAGHVAQLDNVDYFPSYEIITAPVFRGMFYAGNMREVVPDGVAFVMSSFFRDMAAKFGESRVEASVPMPNPIDLRARVVGNDDDEEEAICEEMLLEEFNRA